MLHVVEVRFSGEHFRDFLIRVRGWFETQNTQPTTFRYWFHERETVLRVNFEAYEQGPPSRKRSAGSYWHNLTLAKAGHWLGRRRGIVSGPRTSQEHFG